MPDFDSFLTRLGVSFSNRELLKEAFTHRSYLNENKASLWEHNERLEFLGDAVLELATTHFLFNRFPLKPEGELTSYRAALVNTVSLAGIADELGMNDMLLLSKGESKDTGRARQIILADTFEAFLGALYLDQGYEAAVSFLEANLYPKLDPILRDGSWQDAKSRFQEEAQEKKGITPHYVKVSEEGPDHDKHFTIGVFLGKENIAEGEGKSKQEAEQSAAHNALTKLGW